MVKSLIRKYTFPGLKRWLFFTLLSFSAISLGIALILKTHPITVTANAVWNFLSFIADVVPPTVSGIVAILLGIFFLLFAFFKSNKQILTLVAPDESSLIDALDRHHMHGKGIKIAAIGGGTGLSTMLKGIKTYTSNITAIVTVADDGGSSGRLRESMDIVPPGDIRNCIAALARDDEVITQLFQYRFEDDAPPDLRKHSFGNLFLTALVELGGSKNMAEAVENACKILKTRGKVLPISNEPMHLIAEMEDGSVIHGESKIPEANSKINQLKCEDPCPAILPEVIDAVKDADLIVLGPGSLYTSIIPNLLVTELVEALEESSATKVYVCNVMTQPGETTDYSVADHLEAISKHAHGKKIIDYVLVNNAPPQKKQLEKYATDGQFPVDVDYSRIKDLGIRVFPTNLLQRGNLVRHNFRKLARALAEICLKEEKKRKKTKKKKQKADIQPV